MNKILIVDDSGLSRLKAKKILIDSGYNVSEAVNQQQIRSNTFSADYQLKDMDLVLLDYYLQEGSSLNLLTYLTDHYPSLPIIMVSIESKREIVMKAIDLGAKDYIIKPFKAKVLLNRIGSLLTNRKEDDEDDNIESLDFFLKRELLNLKTNLYLEINRVVRAKDAFFTILKIKLKDKEMDLEKIKENKNILLEVLRGLDQICVLEDGIMIMILPLTDNKGTEKVYKKLLDRIDLLSADDQRESLYFPDDIEDKLEYDREEEYIENIMEKLNI